MPRTCRTSASSPTTEGIDVVATWNPAALNNRTRFSLLFNHTETEVEDFNPATLDATRIRELQEALPENRGTFSVNQRATDRLDVLLRLAYYDRWFDSEDGEEHGGEVLTDVEARIDVNDNLAFVVGGQNIFDQTPEENPGARSGVGNRYSQFSPFGFNGGFWYARLIYGWGSGN